MVSRGKSSVLNALMGQDVFQVGATHGTTVSRAAQRWQHGAADRHGLEGAKLVVVDTPGIDEVGGEVREAIARDVARHADLILFVVSGDMQRGEIEALSELREAHKPIILVFNQIDRYPEIDRDQIYAKIKDERVKHLVRPDDIVMTAAPARRLQGQDPASRRHDSGPVGAARALDRAAQGPDPRRARPRGQSPRRLEHAPDRRRPACRDRRSQDQDPRRCRQPGHLELLAGDRGRGRAQPDTGRRHCRWARHRRGHDRRLEQGLWHPAHAPHGRQPGPRHDARAGRDGCRRRFQPARGQRDQVVAGRRHSALWRPRGSADRALGYATFGLAQAATAASTSYVLGQGAKTYLRQGCQWGPRGIKTVIQQIVAEAKADSVIDRLRDDLKKRLKK